LPRDEISGSFRTFILSPTNSWYTLLSQRRMPISRKRIFRPAAPQAMTIYVRPGYNRVLAEEFEALKVKRVGLVKDKVEAYSQGDLRENFGFKAAKEAIRAVDRKMSALDRFVARNTFTEVDPATWLTKPTATLLLGHVTTIESRMWRQNEYTVSLFS